MMKKPNVVVTCARCKDLTHGRGDAKALMWGETKHPDLDPPSHIKIANKKAQEQ
jgi:hypothetical protein